jgi:hypothetical protein
MARSECEKMESGADQKGTGKGRRGKCRWRAAKLSGEEVRGLLLLLYRLKYTTRIG